MSTIHSMLTIASVSTLQLCLLAADDMPWPAALSYDAGGYWSVRVPITVEHRSRKPLLGVPVEVRIKDDDGTSALIGQTVSSLRVAGADGTEYVFDLQDAQGTQKRAGKLAAGDILTIPVETPGAAASGVAKIETADAEDKAADGEPKTNTAAAPSAITIFLYAGNQDAWLPAEWLGGGLANLGFELGDDRPGAWQPWGVDAGHRMIWQKGGARSGGRCARCEVDEGAEPSWVKYMQRDMPVRPGQRYRFTGWVKAQNVKGRAGWYIHVNGVRPQMVNQSAYAEGTLDWRRMTIEFDVPEGGRTLSCGTLLWGAGTAWYDDVRLETLGDADHIEVRAGPAQHRRLATSDHGAPWVIGEEWVWRAPVTVRNFSAAPLRAGLVTVDVHRLRNRVAKALGFGIEPKVRLANPLSPGQAMDFAGDFANGLYAMTTVPACTEQCLWLYVSSEPRAPDDGLRADVLEWVESPANLAKNGAMEEGRGSRPGTWSAGEEGRDDTRRFSARRVRSGMEGGWCLELTTPTEVKEPGWVGWRQMVPVLPSARYVLSGYVRAKGLDGRGRIHGHFRKADGTHTRFPFFSTDPIVSGDADWTRTSVKVTTPPDCAFIEIHLTMDCYGTLWHDNVLLVRTADAQAGELEARGSRVRDLEAWSVNPLVKVFREDVAPLKPQRRVQVHACRNASKAGQIAVRAVGEGPVRVRVTRLVGPNGAALPSPRLYRVGFVPIDFPMGYASSRAPDYHRLLPRRRGSNGWRGMWPDPLIPVEQGADIHLAANETQPLWLDVHVPKGAAPGQYRGQIEIDGGRTETELPMSVTVWKLAMPVRKHLPAIYDLRRGRGMSPFVGADVKTWYRFLARYNVSPGFVIETPSFEYKNGRVTMDTSAFDDHARLVFDELKVNKVYTPNRWFYACGWSYPPRRIFGLEPFTPEYVAAWKEAYRLFMDHLSKNGWRDRFVYYISDEPHKTSDVTIQGLARIADMAREVAPDMLVYSSTWRYIEGLAGHLTLWGIGPQGSFAPDKHEERRAAGDRFWYTTDGQMCIDTPYLAIEKLLPWFCFKYGCEAYEFWGVSWWTYSPWEKGWHWFNRQSADGKDFRWVRYPNGDGYLAYPGETIGLSEPAPSIRLVAAREGVDDYELFLALNKLADGGNANAQAALDRVRSLVNMPNRGGRYSTDVMPDPDAVRDARIAAGEVLSRLGD